VSDLAEVTSMPRPKRRYSAKVKFQAVLELVKGEKTTGQIAKAYGIHPNSLSQWKQTFLERGSEVFETAGVGSEYAKRISDLERLVGKKEVEIALLKNFLGQTG
jgi:transposase-like protein